MRAPSLSCSDGLPLPVPTKLGSTQTQSDAGAQIARRIDSPPSLVDLPPELLTTICGFADCRSTCQLLKDVIDGSLELQYRIELVRDGMVDCARPSSSLSYSQAQTGTPPLAINDRLARLRQLRRAWKTLSWSRCVTVPMPGPCCAYELVGGIFCKTQPRMGRGLGRGAGLGGGDVWFGNGDVLDGWGQWPGNHGQEDQAPHILDSHTMSATWLPGRLHHGRTVVKDDLGIPTRDFAMDPSQDLMVLFKNGGEDSMLPMMVVFPGTAELHIRTIATNEAHPEARVPVLCMPVMHPITSMFIQIVDDVVGVMYCVDPSRPRITIWNWKLGKLVLDRGSSSLPPSTWDFSFIDSRALLVTTGNDGGTLELFTFTCDDADADADAHSEFDTPYQSERYNTPPTSPLVHAATLHLPPVHPAVQVLSINTHTAPFLAGCPPGELFVASNEERIHMLTIQYMPLPTLDGPRPRPRVCVFVNNRTLKAYAKRGAGKCAGVDTNTAPGRARTATMGVPWKEWGQVHARMLAHAGTFQWLRYVHGQRVVILSPTSRAGKSTLQVLDFNVRSPFDDHDEGDTGVDHIAGEVGAEENARVDLSLSKTTPRRVAHPTQIVMHNIFVDVVESGLPYDEACRDLEGEYSGMMIDDERLVGLKYPAFMTGDMKEIDVFTM